MPLCLLRPRAKQSTEMSWHIAHPRSQEKFIGWSTNDDNSGRRGLSMKRRDFLSYAGMVSASVALRRADRLFPQSTTSPQSTTPEVWRTFDVTTRVEVLKPSGITRIWVPAALITETPFQKTQGNMFNADGGMEKVVSNDPQAMGIIAAEFPPDVKPVVIVKSRITTKNSSVDLSAPGKAAQAK